ncbi:L-type lectin-domain containing receptor kinase V.9-like [Mangifera indica]|uniref:L-type lectin-domain containing receptor kinase V.9-like n=1 Tax=Mangifera indica TaxID=29780 RepID=UPI001CFAAE33|nr:L-type lectin-domain containing receptor kinase V.9-like [Mangifera indica]
MLISVSPARFCSLRLKYRLQRHPLSHTAPPLNNPTLFTRNSKATHFVPRKKCAANNNYTVSLSVASRDFKDFNDAEVVMQQKPQETQGVKEKSFWGAVGLIIGTAVGLCIVPRFQELGGNGLAFTISPSNELSGLQSRYLGLFNITNMGNFANHLFAVEFDKFQSDDFGDIDDNHVGIDINSLVSNKSSTATYFDNTSTLQNLSLTSGTPILAWIDYYATENLLNVTISPNYPRPRLPLLSFNVNLSPIFHEFMYIGFSATGQLSSSYYILGWSLKINGEAGALDLSSLPSIPQKKKKQTDLTIGLCILNYSR